GSTTEKRGQAQQPTECATHADSWMNEIRPKKLIGCRSVNRDRDHKERGFVYGRFRWPIAGQQEKHPREHNRGIPIRELPTAGISVRPEHSDQQTYRNPCWNLVFSAFTKKKEKKWAGNKDGATKAVRV